MRVSNGLKLLVLAIFALACFSLSPLSAGEHPWDENEMGDTDSTIISTGSVEPGELESEIPDVPVYDLFGTPLFWFQIVIDPPKGDRIRTEPRLINSGSGYVHKGSVVN